MNEPNPYSPCPYVCNNKSSSGWCSTTVCINPMYNGHNKTIVVDKQEIVRCMDCDNKECWGRAGNVVCGIDGNPHSPDWFCAYGERKKGR